MANRGFGVFIYLCGITVNEGNSNRVPTCVNKRSLQKMGCEPIRGNQVVARGRANTPSMDCSRYDGESDGGASERSLASWAEQNQPRGRRDPENAVGASEQIAPAICQSTIGRIAGRGPDWATRDVR